MARLPETGIERLARPGAALMYPSPTFVMYSINAALSRMRAVAVPLREDFSFDADAFIARMREEQPALVFLAYPNNPTGVLYPAVDVLRVVEAAPGAVVLRTELCSQMRRMYWIIRCHVQ